MARFALAHMSCGAAWCWEDVAGFLRAAGHTVHAPDFDFRPGATPADHAAQLGEGDVVVGHSYGSLPACGLGGLSPQSALVVIDGFVPDNGDSAHGLRPQHAQERRAQGELWMPWDPIEGMRPMPVSAMETPVAVGALPERRVFVHCLQSDFAEQAERARARGFSVAEVDGGHLWPIEEPAACAALLLAAAAPPLPRDERFVLRDWRQADVDAIAEACNAPDIQKWTRVPKPYRRADAEAWVALAPQLALRGEAIPCCIADARTDAVLGSVGVHAIDLVAQTAELGYWTAPWARRRGVALAGTRMLAGWAFAAFGLRRIELEVDDANEASLRLAERLGARREPGRSVLERQSSLR
jgi:RimJ/RimL family protein N-acetyltransferase